MSEHRRRPVDLDIDTSETIDRILSSFPADCLKDKGRLCQRITTAVARAEHNLKFGAPMDEIYHNAGEAAVEVNNRCHDGITIDEDRRTECGYGKGFDGDVNVYPKWLFPDMPEVTDGGV